MTGPSFPNLRVGAAFPNQFSAIPASVTAVARAVEDAGLDHVLMYDHPVLPAESGGFYGPTDPFLDPLVALSHMAAVTERIELVTGVLILPQRQTAVVARQAADIALLSGGRLRLGVAVGWAEKEYKAMGVDISTRGRRIEQQVRLLRALWSGRSVVGATENESFDDVLLNPVPATAIPIYFGGGADVTYRRAARLGDGFVFPFGFRDETLASWGRLQEIFAEEGRSISGFRSVFNLHAESPEQISPLNVVDRALYLRDAGVTDVTVPMPVQTPRDPNFSPTVEYLFDVGSRLAREL